VSYERLLELANEIAQTSNIKRNPNKLREFMDNVFTRVVEDFDLCKRGFQARAKVYGDAFEAAFQVIMDTLFPEIKLVHTYEIPEICMVAGGEADFVMFKESESWGDLKAPSKRIAAVIEAKGSADYIICNGEVQRLDRPGMMRTDTVKKAISNAAQVKFGLRRNVLFIVATSHKPTTGNAKCMIDLALNSGLFDRVVDATNFKELKEMVDLLKERII